MTSLLVDASSCPVRTAPAVDPTGPELLEAIRGFSAEIDERSGEADALLAVPDDLVARMRAAGMFRLGLPRSLGGLELDPMTTTEIIEEASHADGSTGWTTMIGNATTFFAWLDPAVATQLVGTDGDFISSSMFGPMGRAIPDGDGGFVVDGRWYFNSACVHAQWHSLGVLVMDGDAPRLRADGRPDWRFVFVPHEQVEIVETWDAGGLRATSSHDLTMTAVRVPESHTAMPMFDPPCHDGALWRLGFFAHLAALMSGVPLGIARRALDELIAMAPGKTRGGPGPTMAEDTHVQMELSKAEASLRSARLFFFDSLRAAWETSCHGDEPSAEQQALVQLAMQQCMRAAVEAVDVAYTLAGGGAAYSSHPLQRCFRDIHTATQHLAFRSENWTSYAKLQFGL